MVFCSIPMKSAAIRRAERRAVSPDVMGAAITPSMARIPPNAPSHPLEISFTRMAGLPLPRAH